MSVLSIGNYAFHFLLLRLAQEIKRVKRVFVPIRNRCAIQTRVAAIHHVINASVIFHCQFPHQKRRNITALRLVDTKN